MSYCAEPSRSVVTKCFAGHPHSTTTPSVSDLKRTGARISVTAMPSNSCTRPVIAAMSVSNDCVRTVFWGERFRRASRGESHPILIVAAIPSLEWAEAAVEFGRLRGIPVVIDVRDLWPDVFSECPAKRGGRSLGRFLSPYARMARCVLRATTGAFLERPRTTSIWRSHGRTAEAGSRFRCAAGV